MRLAIQKYCPQGMENGCDGSALVRGAAKKPPCFFFDAENKKCTQPDLVKCKKTIRLRILRRSK
jgi:hypothetical protein